MLLSVQIIRTEACCLELLLRDSQHFLNGFSLLIVKILIHLHKARGAFDRQRMHRNILRVERQKRLHRLREISR